MVSFSFSGGRAPRTTAKILRPNIRRRRVCLLAGALFIPLLLAGYFSAVRSFFPGVGVGGNGGPSSGASASGGGATSGSAVALPPPSVPEAWDAGNEPWFEDIFPFGYGKPNSYGIGVPGTAAVASFLRYVAPFLSCDSSPLTYPRPAKDRNIVLVDVIQVAYDIDNLEIRLWESSPHADYFLVVESTTTQRGVEKPLYFEHYRHRFADLRDRIVFAPHEGERATETGPQQVRKDDWVNEFATRQYAYGLVQRLEKKTNKKVVVITGDLDEIWTREALSTLLADDARAVGPDPVCPAILASFKNSAYIAPPSVGKKTRGQVPVAFSLPQPENAHVPFHRCDAFSPGTGYHLGGFLSPYAHLAKDLCLAEGGGVSGAHADPRDRLRDPYITFDKIKVGIRPCCGQDKPGRLWKEGDPKPRLLVERPERFPYLLGRDDRCPPYRQPAEVYDLFECTDARKLFDLC